MMMKVLCKSNLVVGIVAGVLLVGLNSAQALEVKLSGQINRAMMWADNGNNDELFHVDNDNSSTRFRLVGSEKVSDRIEVGVVWESQFESNSSSSVDIGQDGDGASSFTERKLEAWFGNQSAGKLWIGQGDGAANGTSEVDLSGTSVIIYSGVNDTAGSINFRDSNDTVITTIGSTRSNFDGLSRNDRLRYDSPSFFGTTVSASITNGDAWELAGRWAGEFQGLGKIAAAVGLVDNGDRGTDFQQLGGSVSWLAPFGLNLTFAGGIREWSEGSRDGDDSLNLYTKVGYKWDIHAVAGEFGQTNDLAADGDESRNVGAAYVITPWSGVDFYATIRTYELERDGVDNIEDIGQIMVGTRVKF
jgi:predicted porin